MHLIVGQIVRPHGVRGEVIVDVRTDDPEARFAVGATLVTSVGGGSPPDTAAPVAGPAPASGAPEIGGPGGPGAPPDRSAVPSGGIGVAGLAAGAGQPDGVRWTVPAALTIESVRAHQGRLIVSFGGVYDRDVAEELRGVLLWVDAAGLAPPADPDEFHDYQLVGLTAVTPAGETLGAVARIDHAPASDLLVVSRPAGGTALVPFVKQIVPEVDLAGGRIIIDPPGGLFDL